MKIAAFLASYPERRLTRAAADRLDRRLSSSEAWATADGFAHRELDA